MNFAVPYAKSLVTGENMPILKARALTTYLQDITLAKSLMRIGSVFLEDLQIMKPLSMHRYGSVRKVYIVCKQDRTLQEEFQRWMVSNNPVDEMKEIGCADHMAMLSAPDDIVQCIVDIVAKYS